MSATAFKRDLADWKTITDFVAQVQSIDRLRQLAHADHRRYPRGRPRHLEQLEAPADRRALRMRRKSGCGLATSSTGANSASPPSRPQVAERLGERRDLVGTLGRQLSDAYWIAEPDDIIAMNLIQFDKARGKALDVCTEYYAARGATLVTVIAADHPGLFYRIAGGIHLAGGNIIDARIHTAKNGMAVDNFLVQDPLGRPFMEDSQLARIRTIDRRCPGQPGQAGAATGRSPARPAARRRLRGAPARGSSTTRRPTASP
jgi:[protein-PII] uridylyltransferase